MQPRQILDTSMPVDPSLPYCIPFLHPSLGATASARTVAAGVVGDGVCRVPPAALQRVGGDLRRHGPGRRPWVAGQGPDRQQRRARRGDAGVRPVDARRHAVGRGRRRPLPQAHRAAARRADARGVVDCWSASPSSPTSSSTGCCSSPAPCRPPPSPSTSRRASPSSPRSSSPDQIGDAVVLSQTVQEAMRVIAPALAGVLIGVSWFGVGGVFLLAAGTSTLAAARAARAAAGRAARLPTRSPHRRDGRRRPVRALAAQPRVGRPDDDRRRRHRLPVPDVPADARRRALRRRRRRLRR